MKSTVDADRSVTRSRRSERRVTPAGGGARRVHVVHVTSSRFYGGPERQMFELAHELAPEIDSSFVSFSEGNLCQAFLGEVVQAGYMGRALKHDTPHLMAAAKELKQLLTELRADVLCAHGYKACLLGLWAARQCGIPIVAVSRGWTAENWRVRLYESLDRLALRRMDRVVCVSHGQAHKVRQAGVSANRIAVIRNAIRTERFERPRNAADRDELQGLFPTPPRYLVGAAGRLSPEKGFGVLVEACHRLVCGYRDLDFGVVLFGEGPLRDDLQRQIEASGLRDRFQLAGFRGDFDRFMPHFDLFVQSSHTEGLPNVLLEAAVAGTPVVATQVGGTPEVVIDEETGLLAPPNNPQALAAGIHRLLCDEPLRTAIKKNASRHVAEYFTFAAQAAAYRALIASVIDTTHRAP